MVKLGQYICLVEASIIGVIRVSKKEPPPKLWSRGMEHLKPRVGELEPDVSSLHKTIDEAQRLRLLKPRDDGYAYTGEVRFDIPAMKDPTTKDKELPSFSSRAEARFKPGEETLLLDLYTNEDTELSMFGATRSYTILPDGMVINFTSDDGVAVDTGSRESQQIEIALNQIERRLQDRVSDALYERRDRRERARSIFLKALAGTITGVVIVGGAIFGINKLIVEPNEAAEAQRQAYDQEPHQLPGEGISIDSHPFATMPADQFNEIPTYGGSDTDFTYPRTVNINRANGCVDVTAEIKENDVLYVALPDDSLYINNHYGTASTDTGFSLCIVEPTPNDGYETDITVAIQIKPATESNEK